MAHTIHMHQRDGMAASIRHLDQSDTWYMEIRNGDLQFILFFDSIEDVEAFTRQIADEHTHIFDAPADLSR